MAQNSDEPRNGNSSSRTHLVYSGVSIVSIAAIAAIFLNPVKEDLEEVKATESKNHTVAMTQIGKVEAESDNSTVTLHQRITSEIAKLENKTTADISDNRNQIVQLKERLAATAKQGTDDRFRKQDFSREIARRDDRDKNHEKEIDALRTYVKELHDMVRRINDNQLLCRCTSGLGPLGPESRDNSGLAGLPSGLRQALGLAGPDC